MAPITSDRRTGLFHGWPIVHPGCRCSERNLAAHNSYVNSLVCVLFNVDSMHQIVEDPNCQCLCNAGMEWVRGYLIVIYFGAS
jgi:hypothetical protein